MEKSLTLRGAGQLWPHKDWRKLLAWMEEGRIAAPWLITHTFPLSDGEHHDVAEHPLPSICCANLLKRSTPRVRPRIEIATERVTSHASLAVKRLGSPPRKVNKVMPDSRSRPWPLQHLARTTCSTRSRTA